MEIGLGRVMVPSKWQKLRKLMLVFRPWSFIMTFISVMVGSLMSLLITGQFNHGLFMLVLIGLVSVHAATNIVNDLFDTIYGIDKADSATAIYRPHPLLDRVLSAKGIVFISLVLYATAALVGLYLFSLRGWPIAALAIIGAFASVAYTAGPVKYKYRGWGEISVFLMWGPLMTFGAYYVQTNTWAGAAIVLLISVPLGIWVALVLLANNLKDMLFDCEMEIVTAATRLGQKKALWLFTAMIYAIYAFTALGILLNYFSWWMLLIFPSLPLAQRMIANFKKHIPQNADPQAARLSTCHGMLLIISLLLEHLLPL